MLKTNLLIFIAKIIIIFAEINICPEQMKKHSRFYLNKLKESGGDYHSLHKIYIFQKFIISFNIEVDETSLASENFSVII